MSNIESTNDEEFMSVIDDLLAGVSDSPEVQVIEDSVEVNNESTIIEEGSTESDPIIDNTEEQSTEDRPIEETPEVVQEEVAVKTEGVVETANTESLTVPPITEEYDLDEYNKYKEFFNKVTASINIDGNELSGISDPNKVLEIQKKFFTDSGKLDELEKVRPFVKTLQDEGFIDDPEKIGLAVEILKGNKDAIKTLLKDKGIDPFELDLEEINKESMNTEKYYTSPDELKFNDFIGKSKSYGVSDEVAEQVIGNWDIDSITTLVNDDEQSIANILSHVKSGVYVDVQTEITNQERLDLSGKFRRKNMYQKYAEASQILASKNKATTPIVKEVKEEVITPTKPVETVKVDVEKRAEKASKASKANTSSVGTVESTQKDLMEVDDDTFMAELSKYL